MGKTKVVALNVVETETGKVVHTVKLNGFNDPDKVTRGMLRNMNTDRYHVAEVTEQESGK